MFCREPEEFSRRRSSVVWKLAPLRIARAFCALRSFSWCDLLAGVLGWFLPAPPPPPRASRMDRSGVSGTECVPLDPPRSPPCDPKDRIDDRWESSRLSSAADPTDPPRLPPTLTPPPLAPEPDSFASPLAPPPPPLTFLADLDGFRFGLLLRAPASVEASSIPIPPRPRVANAAPMSLLFRACRFFFSRPFSRSLLASIRPSRPSAAAPVSSNTGGRSGTPPAPPPTPPPPLPRREWRPRILGGDRSASAVDVGGPGGGCDSRRAARTRSRKPPVCCCVCVPAVPPPGVVPGGPMYTVVRPSSSTYVRSAGRVTGGSDDAVSLSPSGGSVVPSPPLPTNDSVTGPGPGGWSVSSLFSSAMVASVDPPRSPTSAEAFRRASSMLLRSDTGMLDLRLPPPPPPPLEGVVGETATCSIGEIASIGPSSNAPAVAAAAAAAAAAADVGVEYAGLAVPARGGKRSTSSGISTEIPPSAASWFSSALRRRASSASSSSWRRAIPGAAFVLSGIRLRVPRSVLARPGAAPVEGARSVETLDRSPDVLTGNNPSRPSPTGALSDGGGFAPSALRSVFARVRLPNFLATCRITFSALPLAPLGSA